MPVLLFRNGLLVPQEDGKYGLLPPRPRLWSFTRCGIALGGVASLTLGQEIFLLDLTDGNRLKIIILRFLKADIYPRQQGTSGVGCPQSVGGWGWGRNHLLSSSLVYKLQRMWPAICEADEQEAKLGGGGEVALPSGRKSLADKYEYVMYGKLYKFSDQETGGSVKIEVYVSFGGLLMLLKGDPGNLGNLMMDQRLYLLMRKVG
ncbi:hypothetical protein L7F22_034624 [Adiantum nelumboides]|nr:hypothetical protein [Adiantum nelumboides]